MKLRRREFLQQTVMGVGGALVGAPRLAGAASPPARFDPYALVPLGKTGLRVSRFCLGTGMRGGMRASNQTRLGKARFEALIRESFDRGTRLFDLADLYGTHPYVFPALKGIARHRYSLVTKIWFREGGIPEAERPGADVCVARFLRELRSEYIDLVLLHCVTSPRWPTELRRQMDLLSALKDKGRVRAVGVSCHSLGALEAAASEPWVDSVHARINPYGMSMDAAPEKVVPLLQRIHAAGKGVVGMKIMGEGRLRHDEQRRDASVGYVLTLGCVDVLNVGCENLAEVDDLAARVRRVMRPTV
ncbi:MAG: aldo/keto reductase [Acidobacteria bacterium]|nr:MAG: aldo/keto reductase [Acidobacteriota bacterium]RPJ82225.1 MAG: aldo/keto reductase [Acidobacteriota bacterium]